MSVTDDLRVIADALSRIDDACDEYGGWAGEDDEAKTALDLGLQLANLGWAVALGGRAWAEGGPVPWTQFGKSDPQEAS